MKTARTRHIVESLQLAASGALVLVFAEFLVASFLGHAAFVGAWEIARAFGFVLPFGWLVSVPLALVGAALLEATRRAHDRRFRLLVALAATAFATAVAIGVTTGRHFEKLPIRAAFCATLALVGFALAYAFAPALDRLVRTRPRTTALLALASALVLELANLLVLPRLYPAFHAGLLALTMLLAPFVGLGLHPLFSTSRWRAASMLGLFAAFVAAPFSAKKLALLDNLRLVYLDRAPLLRQGIELAAHLAPPPPIDADDAFVAHAPSTRALDWRGRDIVLITVDALRADHLGIYGYERPTSPNLDALGQEGVVFERAYAPTPHTSYSLTSLLTGKHMRPLVLQGLGEDSDTFAALLRTYGYRTAAFYPPAVFFVDGDKLASFRDKNLDFEYVKVEFADVDKRLQQVTAYVSRRKPERRLFLWIHLFEPHEPYVAHEDFPFGDRDVDRYDAEIAMVDRGIGAIVNLVREKRPEAVFIVTADHGEEFGEHGGRFHGTSVYEEQVRVPLIIAAPGSMTPKRIREPVQTIDILPTVLSALDIPRPARMRGRDLGLLLRDGRDPSHPEGIAFAEAEGLSLLAEGSLRLVCQRRVGACALYDLETDPLQKRDVSREMPERFEAMKEKLRKISASHGQYERAGLRSEGKAWPEALRRALAGDGDAAIEVAALLDDAEVIFRRKAAEVLFALRRKEAMPSLRLALARDEDEEVRTWSALALTRMGDPEKPALSVLEKADAKWARLAALALADAGDARGGEVLASWWETDPPADLGQARELITALGKVRESRAVPALVRTLDDFRLRPQAAKALASIGDLAARKALSEKLAEERYEPIRVVMAEALVKLGAKEELAGPLLRFLGTPDPLPRGLAFAKEAGILPLVGGVGEAELRRLRQGKVQVTFAVPSGGNGRGHRVLVQGRSTDAQPASLRVGPLTLELPSAETPVQAFATLPAELSPDRGRLRLPVEASPNALVETIAVVPLADEIPPPPPEPWDGPVGDDEDEPD